jgi:3-hydroxyisobutyrate dehydrogenase-like beta-hydroxyacid dehydrogenase
MALKLSRNATGYVMMAAVHEAMLLASSAGVDLALLRRTIDETGVFAQALAPFALGGPEARPGDAPESFRSMLEHVRSLGEKDLDLHKQVETLLHTVFLSILLKTPDNDDNSC